jgi:heme exporter protein A
VVTTALHLIADQLVILRGSRVIIDTLSFTVGGGEALVLAGANGAGKTTLLRALAGFLTVERGVIRLDPNQDDAALHERMHVIGHTNGIKSSLTVRENIMFWASYLSEDDGSDASRRADRALEHFGLTTLEDFPAQYLSAGQKRRLGLARLLAAHRPVWLLDEPTVSLDTASVAQLAIAVNEHTRAGGMVIAATHVPLGLERARELRLVPAGPSL